MYVNLADDNDDKNVSHNNPYVQKMEFWKYMTYWRTVTGTVWTYCFFQIIFFIEKISICDLV